uniref:restriction endonuclease subunit S n=1 Tax=Pseudomonas sp. TaxID=306 RepID=UPI001162655C|nr:restriction endonuclease subunit S [Pseudomonas sp.]QDK64829.1 type I restriction enzyme EcoKI specificity protein, S subunit [Pseudomonas sp.]
MRFEMNHKVKFRTLLVEPVRNGIYKQKEFHGRGCKIINMGELFGFPRMHDVPMKRVELTEKEQSKSLVQQGDLLFARRSLVAEGAGKCSIVSEVNEPTTFESSIIRARPNPALASSDYLYYYFSSPLGRERMATILRQMAVSGITGSDLMELEIECPKLEHQRTIATFLSALDDRIALLRETNATLEAIAQALFKSWFVDFDPVRAKAAGLEPEGMDAATAALFPDSFEESELGLVPREWATRPIYDMASYINGAAYKAFEPNAERRGIPIIKIAELKAGVTSQTAFSDVVMPEKYLIKTGDILFSWSGNPDTSIDTFVWGYDPALLNQHIFRVLPNIPTERSFVLQTLRNLKPVFAELARNKQTTGLGHVTVADLKRLHVVNPPGAVIEQFNNCVETIHQMIFGNEQQAQTLTHLRDTLLPRLISGQLRLPEAEAQIEAVCA